MPERVVERVLDKVEMGPKTQYVDTPCHLSTYSTASHGYAQVGWNEGQQRCLKLCHVVIWTAANGPVPKGITVDHQCHTKRCIRLDHLRALTNQDNAMRNRPGMDWMLDGSCARGHDAELRVPINYADGYRRTRCSACVSEDSAKKNARPETKARKAAYAARPDVQARRAEALARHNTKPETKARKAEWQRAKRAAQQITSTT